MKQHKSSGMICILLPASAYVSSKIMDIKCMIVALLCVLVADESNVGSLVSQRNGESLT